MKKHYLAICALFISLPVHAGSHTFAPSLWHCDGNWASTLEYIVQQIPCEAALCQLELQRRPPSGGSWVPFWWGAPSSTEFQSVTVLASPGYSGWRYRYCMISIDPNPATECGAILTQPAQMCCGLGGGGQDPYRPAGECDCDTPERFDALDWLLSR